MVDWLNISAISGSGNASIIITATSHTELTRRLAAIKFKNTEHNLTAQTSVVQDAYVPEPIHVVVNPTSIDNIPQSGGSYEICVQSNGDWTVQVPSWATSTIASGSGNQCFTVTVGENDKESMNIGDIVISSVDETKYVPLIQEAYEPCDLSYTGNTGILYELDRVVFPVSGGSVDVAISTTHKWEAFVGRTDSEWLSITPTSGVGNGSVTVTAKPNHTANIRRTHDMFMTSEFTGFVESANESTRGVCGHQLFATQPYVKISEDLIFETDATAITTTLICDVEFNRLRVISTEDWLHVSSAVTDFKIDISVDENTGEERTGYIQFYFEGILVYAKEVTQMPYIEPTPECGQLAYFAPRQLTRDDFYIPAIYDEFIHNEYQGGIGVLGWSGDTTFIPMREFQAQYNTGAAENGVMTKAVLPECIIEIGDSAFTNNQKLEVIKFSDNIETIRQYAFDGCINLYRRKNVKLPNNLDYIGGYAFQGNSFASIEIPSGVTYIGNNAFYSTTSGRPIVEFKGTTPPTLGTRALGNTSLTIPIYVPKESLSEYKTMLSSYSNAIKAKNIQTYPCGLWVGTEGGERTIEVDAESFTVTSAPSWVTYSIVGNTLKVTFPTHYQSQLRRETIDIRSSDGTTDSIVIIQD